MAVSEGFREQWLECEEEYGKNIEAGDMPVIDYGEVDETISLPAVKFTAPFNPDGTNVFDSYAHVPMKTFKKRIDDLAGEVSDAPSRTRRLLPRPPRTTIRGPRATTRTPPPPPTEPTTRQSMPRRKAATPSNRATRQHWWMQA